MHFKAKLTFGTLALICATVIASVTPSARKMQDADRERARRLTVVTTQLQRENGVVPVELRCQDAELPTPDKLDGLSCVIKNNTTRNIIAATLAVSITVEKDGSETADTGFLTVETFLHPDFRDEHRNNQIRPGGEYPVRDAPVTYYDAVIKGVMLRIDYVEFEDHTSSGPDTGGSRIIAEMRAGAAKYKNWLRGRYDRGGRSVESVVSAIESPSLPEDEMGITSVNQSEGAVLYRNYARRTYQAKGAEGLLKRLRLANAAAGGG